MGSVTYRVARYYHSDMSALTMHGEYRCFMCLALCEAGRGTVCDCRRRVCVSCEGEDACGMCEEEQRDGP